MMTIFNDQWQGSGLTDEIWHGSQTLRDILGHEGAHHAQTVTGGMARANGIVAYEALLSQTLQLKEAIADAMPSKVMTLGGDCGVEIMPVSYLNQNYPRLGVLWFDAHGDLNTPEQSPSGNFHGMPVRLLLGEGDVQLSYLCFSQLAPWQWMYVGVRDLDIAEEAYIAAKSMFLTRQWDEGLVGRYIADKGFTHLYIHLDLDVLDPGEFAQTKYPTPGGLKIATVMAALQVLATQYEVVGYSMTEGTMGSVGGAAPIMPIIEFFKQQWPLAKGLG